MKNLIIIMAVLFYLPLGCAALQEQKKMKEYALTMDSYETAMRLSDFNAACRYVDPAELGHKDCLAQYENLKIVSYEVLGVNVAENKKEVAQTIEVEYFIIDRVLVKKIQYEQSWRYKENLEKWQLYIGPSHFE